MNTLLSYRLRGKLFYPVLFLAMIGASYQMFSHYLVELPTSENGGYKSYLYENSQTIENSTHQRSRTHAFTFQAPAAGIATVTSNYSQLVVSMTGCLSPGSLPFSLLPRQVLLLFCRLLI